MVAQPSELNPALRPGPRAAGAVCAWAVTLLLLAAGCAAPGRPPVVERSPVFERPADGYRVQPGDTLYSVAWRFGLDHRALARANGIAPPYTIYVGQRLRLAEQAASVSARPPAPKPPGKAPTPGPRAPRRAVSGWAPPTSAPVLRAYGSGNRGIDYQLDAGHPVQAAASGEVVYAGSGLGGFRHLVILSHDEHFLSAYGFDRPMAVREGETIKAGGVLADTVTGGRRAGTLHFEIRKDGDPVDPGELIGSR